MLNRQGRPTRPDGGGGRAETPTSSGHRGLDHEEPLLFELDKEGRSGVDFPPAPKVKTRLGGLERRAPVGLPGLSEPQIVRHFVRLSRRNYAIDMGMYPLGSCTMKYNPRLNEKLARLAGLGDLHPMQPVSTVQGALELIDQLTHWLKTLTGMPAIAMSPAAGAQGELCGLMAMHAALKARGERRRRVLVPDSAHGTNPATATLCGYEVEAVPNGPDGRIDMAAFTRTLSPDVAAVMVTNPNTCGLFERQMPELAEGTHGVGAYLYCDGANFNAIAGRVRPGDLGIDAMHINLHKTFSTPHGGGGPGAGPVAFSKDLSPYIPVPYVVHDAAGWRLVEHPDGGSFGRLKTFHGQMGMFIRALAYMSALGGDGIRQMAEDAVLNANYLKACVADVMTPSYPGPCMHEALFDDRFLDGTGVTTLDFAKAMIDEGYHPMTVYFPLVVHGAMLVEPTESESKESLDAFIATLRHLAERARGGEKDAFTGAPRLAPRRRLDETQAARRPVLRWRPPNSQAAE